MSSRTISLALTTTGTVDCQGLVSTDARAIKRTAITNNYTILTTDYLIGCDTSSNTITVTLPLASGTTNQVFYIIDETGNSQTNNITITRSGSDTINGQTSAIINTNYSSITIYSDGGTGFHII